MNDEDFCFYCGCYWRVSHTKACPSTTGVYPMSDFRGESILCGKCHEPMEDYYTTVGDVVVCLGCAAHRNLLQ